jgi:hypothetical protein
MLRLYKYNNNGEYKDFSNDLFRRCDKTIEIDFENNLVAIDNEQYRLSGIAQLSGDNAQTYAIGLALLDKFKSDIKNCFKNLLNCQ